jgi:preprotein translocase subunit SecE
VAPTRTRNLEQPEEDIELLDEQDEEEELEEAVSGSRRRGSNGDEGKSKERRPRQKQSRAATNATGINRIPVLRSLVAYFRGVVSELQKVTWPSREETTRLTLVVLGVTVAFAIGLGTLDYFLGWWFKQAIRESQNATLTFLLVGAGIAVALGGGFAWLRRQI